MRHIYCFFGLFFALPYAKHFKEHALQNVESKNELVGVWSFHELLNSSGQKIDTIKHSFGWEIPAGPLITFHRNGTYTKQFTTQDIDKGKWEYSGVGNKIIYYLLLDEKESTSKFLISRGVAKKQADGKFYELITDSIIKLTHTELVLYEQPGRHRIFRKSK